MVKALITGHYICRTTNILSYTFRTVHWTQASLSFLFLKKLFSSSVFLVYILPPDICFVNTILKLFLNIFSLCSFVVNCLNISKTGDTSRISGFYLAFIIINQATFQDNFSLVIRQVSEFQLNLFQTIAYYICFHNIPFFFHCCSHIRNKNIISVLKA